MEKFTNLAEAIQQSFYIVFYKTANVVPNILGVIIILLAGWIIARSLRFVLMKALTKGGSQKFLDKVSEHSFISKYTDYSLAKLLANIVYWFVLLFSVVFASETLGWTTVSQELSNIIDYLPQFFTGFIIFAIGVYLASFVKNFLSKTLEVLHRRSRIILSTVVYYFLLILVSITALNQVGVDTGFISSNLTLIVGSFLLAFSLAFGLGAQHTLSNLLAALYAKRIFSEGDKVVIDNEETQIIKIEDTSVVLKTIKGRIVVPAKTFMNSKVEILA